MQDQIVSETIYMLLKWLIIIAIWLLLAVDLIRDGIRIRRLQDSITIVRILYLLHKRNIQVFGLFSMLLIVLGANDMGNSPSRQHEPVAEKPAVQESAQQPADSNQPPLPQNPSNPFSGITEFNEKNGKQQAYIDLLKERYEMWLITYYYLQKCNAVDPKDLDTIAASMEKELAAYNADGNVENNIKIAANGSYKELYSTIPCDKDHIAKTKASYDGAMQRIKAVPDPEIVKPENKPQLTPVQ